MKNLLIIGFVLPEPKSSAAGSRILQLIHQFKKQDYNITFVTSANYSDKAFDLSKIGVKTERIELNSSSFDTYIKKLNPNIVLFDRFMSEEQYGWRVSEHCPNAIRILDTEDFHGLRKGREEALKNKENFDLNHLYNDTTKREIASMYRCDLSLVISEVEMELFINTFNINPSLLYYLPFLIESNASEKREELPCFKSRQYFMTIGNFLHAPNYDGVLYLKNEIWPLIRKRLPKSLLHVYGAYPSQKVSQLHNEKDGFLIKGYAEDANRVMQNARVCLAPLRFGAGLKGKLIDAMKNGTPSVMSSIASEGMFGENSVNGFIDDIPENFAESACELYSNQTLWKQKQGYGFYNLDNRFYAAKFEFHFKNIIKNICGNLTHHRQQNFIGQMLGHHTLQSTKYMSKWIEEKNK